MTGNANPTVRTLGTLHSVDGAGVVRIEDRFDTPAVDLWSAVTDPERLGRWYGHVSGDLHEGGRFQLRIDGPDFDGTGRIVECRPPLSLRVQTRETDESALRGTGEPITTTVDVTLTPDGDGTVLVIEILGLPLDKIGAYGVGWQLHAENLGNYLAGRAGADVGTRWAELAGPYADLAAHVT